MDTYTLYYWPDCSSLAPHIVLRWINASYRLVRAGLYMRHDDAFQKINPASTLPVLVDEDGWGISQNTAILNYLAEQHPAAHLSGGDVRGRAQVNRWLDYINADVSQAFCPLLHPEKFSDDAHIQELARDALRQHFEILDEALREHEWIAGEHRSIADPYVFVVTRWAHDMGVALHGLSGLAAHYAKMQRDVDVQLALVEEGLMGRASMAHSVN